MFNNIHYCAPTHNNIILLFILFWQCHIGIIEYNSTYVHNTEQVPTTVRNEKMKKWSFWEQNYVRRVRV